MYINRVYITTAEPCHAFYRMYNLFLDSHIYSHIQLFSNVMYVHHSIERGAVLREIYARLRQPPVRFLEAIGYLRVFINLLYSYIDIADVLFGMVRCVTYADSDILFKNILSGANKCHYASRFERIMYLCM